MSMDVQVFQQQYALLKRAGSCKRGRAKIPLRKRRGLRCIVPASASGLEQPGELGWSTARAELALGTLVGTGSYGIVREAELKGLQVH